MIRYGHRSLDVSWSNTVELIAADHARFITDTDLIWRVHKHAILILQSLLYTTTARPQWFRPSGLLSELKFTHWYLLPLSAGNGSESNSNKMLSYRRENALQGAL